MSYRKAAMELRRILNVLQAHTSHSADLEKRPRIDGGHWAPNPTLTNLEKAPIQKTLQVYCFEIISLDSLFGFPALRLPGKILLAVPDADKWIAGCIYSFEPGEHINICRKLTKARRTPLSVRTEHWKRDKR